MPDDPPEEPTPPESTELTVTEETEDLGTEILIRLDAIDARLTTLENSPVGEHAHDYAGTEHAHEGYAAYEHAHEEAGHEEPPPEDDISPRREHFWFRRFGT